MLVPDVKVVDKNHQIYMPVIFQVSLGAISNETTGKIRSRGFEESFSGARPIMQKWRGPRF